MLQNRVTPFGDIVAVPQRYQLPWARMGNRGILHDDHRRLVRSHKGKAWIICRLRYKNRRRQVMSPGTYTELFFLDEYVALAAGHRPCAMCRRDDFRSFALAFPGTTLQTKAGAIDDTLRDERGKRWPLVDDDLPNGAMLAVHDDACLVWDRRLWTYSHDGYADRGLALADLDTDTCTVLTPPSTLAVLHAGWLPTDAGETPFPVISPTA